VAAVPKTSKFGRREFEKLCIKFLSTAERGLPKIGIPSLINKHHDGDVEAAVTHALDARAVRIFAFADADNDMMLNVREACALQSRLGRSFGPDGYKRFCDVYGCIARVGIDVVAFDSSYGQPWSDNREALLAADFARVFEASRSPRRATKTDGVLQVGSEVEARLPDDHHWFPAVVLKVLDANGDDLPPPGTVYSASERRHVIQFVDLEFQDGRVVRRVPRSAVQLCSLAKWYFRRAQAHHNTTKGDPKPHAAVVVEGQDRRATDGVVNRHRLTFREVTRLCRITGNRPISNRAYDRLCALLGCSAEQGLGLAEYENIYQVGTQPQTRRVEDDTDGADWEELWLLARRLVPHGALASSTQTAPLAISPSRRHLRTTLNGQLGSTATTQPFTSSLRKQNRSHQMFGTTNNSTRARKLSKRDAEKLPLRQGLRVEVQVFKGGPWVPGHVATAPRVDGKFNVRLDNEDPNDILRGVPRDRVRVHPDVAGEELAHFRPAISSAANGEGEPLGGAFGSMTSRPSTGPIPSNTKVFTLHEREGLSSSARSSNAKNRGTRIESAGNRAGDSKAGPIRRRTRVFVQLYPRGPWVQGTVTAVRRDKKYNVKLDFEQQTLLGVRRSELRVADRFGGKASKSKNNIDQNQPTHHGSERHESERRRPDRHDDSDESLESSHPASTVDKPVDDGLPEELDVFDGDTQGDNVQGFVSDVALEARFAGGKKWYPGKITKVNMYEDGTRTYDFRYLSGMRERGVPRHYIRKLQSESRRGRQRFPNEGRRIKRAEPRLAMSIKKKAPPSQVDLFNSGLLSVKALRTTKKHGHDAHQARGGRLPQSRPGKEDPGYGGIKVGSRVKFREPMVASDMRYHTHGDVVAVNSDESVNVRLGEYSFEMPFALHWLLCHAY